MTAIAWQPIASTLSPREKEVMAALLTGRSRKQIARALYISTTCVDLYIRRARDKLEDQGLELVLSYQIRRKG